MDDDEPITELIAALKLGDEIAARRLWDLYRRRVAGLAQKVLLPKADRSDVSDVVQSAFAAVFAQARAGKLDPTAGRPGVVNRDNLRRYLLTVAFHRAITKAKRITQARAREAALADVVARWSDDEIRVDILEMLDRVKRSLDPVGLQVFETFLATPLTQQQIAEERSCSIAKVERTLRRVREALHSELDAE
jgi:RNA polymerase sigma factor (sigma-70 family)